MPSRWHLSFWVCQDMFQTRQGSPALRTHSPRMLRVSASASDSGAAGGARLSTGAGRLMKLIVLVPRACPTLYNQACKTAVNPALCLILGPIQGWGQIGDGGGETHTLPHIAPGQAVPRELSESQRQADRGAGGNADMEEFTSKEKI